MTVTLKLEPEVEAGLTALARARGMPLDACLQNILEQFVMPASNLEMSPEQKAEAFRQWAEGFPNTTVLSEEAMSRDAIYRRDDGSPR